MEGVGQVFALLALLNEVVDELVVRKTASEGALALLVDLLEQPQQLAPLGTHHPLQPHELQRVEHDRAVLQTAAQQGFNNALKSAFPCYFGLY
jgi:hypothetical protein